jgi:hypothetical protein
MAAATRWSYGASTHSATEPAAWAAMALIAHGETDAALRPAQWLAHLQQADGSVGISAADYEPRWPTGLALWGWQAWDDAAGTVRFAGAVSRAASWSLADRGTTGPRSPMIGHDTTLAGWSWAPRTHSWLEPTCFFVLGLRAAGYANHARTREGAHLIVDRLLPDGGANYGNTVVLGQPLLPHVEPTGLALWALADFGVGDERLEKSVQYLERAVGPELTPASLAFACLGLTAHGRRPSRAEAWLLAALDNQSAQPLSDYERALLVLAAQPNLAWARGTLSNRGAVAPASGTAGAATAE